MNETYDYVMYLPNNFTHAHIVMLAPLNTGAVCDIWQICRSLMFKDVNKSTYILMEYKA